MLEQCLFKPKTYNIPKYMEVSDFVLILDKALSNITRVLKFDLQTISKYWIYFVLCKI